MANVKLNASRFFSFIFGGYYFSRPFAVPKLEL